MNGPDTGSRHSRGDRTVLFGIGIDNLDLAGVLEALEGLIAAGRPSLVVTPNAQHIDLLSRDREFRSAYHGASLVIADGVSIVWTSVLLGRRLKARVAGSDILPAFCSTAARKGYRLFFLGAGPGIAARAADRLTDTNPGLLVCGTYSPPFGFEHDAGENERIIECVRSRRPDALFIGLGTPKSEKWAWAHLAALGVPAVVCVGAGFDFVAGSKRRAPCWMQAAGLEWFYRLIQEPGRLWERYLVGNARFLARLVKEIVRRKAPEEGLGNGPIDIERIPKGHLLKPKNLIIKKSLSLILALISCVVLIPWFLIIAAAILLDSRGPVFYSQDRVGKDGKLFKIFKFRSMHIDADLQFDALLERDLSARAEWKEFQKTGKGSPRDPRRTIPAQMEPRRAPPATQRSPRGHEPDRAAALSAARTGAHPGTGPFDLPDRPGITGLWQVRGRNLLTFDDRLHLDEFYIHNWSFWLDTVILLKTVRVLLRNEGAF